MGHVHQGGECIAIVCLSALASSLDLPVDTRCMYGSHMRQVLKVFLRMQRLLLLSCNWSGLHAGGL